MTRNAQPEYAAFGAWLTARRREHFPGRGGQTRARQAFAEIAGWEPHAVTWSKWENGHALPQDESLAILEKMFGKDRPREPIPPDYESQLRDLLAEELRPVEEALRELVDELRQRAR